jgi:hypothetical protein
MWSGNLQKNLVQQIMKKSIQLLFFLLPVCMTAIHASAQVTRNCSVGATIVTVVTLTKTYDLDFGNLAVNTVPGYCVLEPASGSNPPRNVSGGVTLPSFQGTLHAAEFKVSGIPSEIFTITIPRSDIIINSGANSMVVGNYTTDQTVLTAGTSWSGVFGINGTTFHVGATVIVGGSQPTGHYQNIAGFPVIVNYQ